MELLTYSALKKSSILLSPTMNKEKDRCGDEPIVKFTTMLVANLGKRYNYSISQFQEGSTNQSNVQNLCLPVSPVMSCTAPKTSQDEGRPTRHFILFPLLFIPGHAKEEPLAMPPWSLLFSDKSLQRVFQRILAHLLQTQKWPQLEQYLENVKEISIESVTFSLYRHILNSHFYRSQLDIIQTPVLEKACTMLLSMYKRVAGVPFSFCLYLRYLSRPEEGGVLPFCCSLL